MDSSELEKIKLAALALPERERAELARDLIGSLDGPADIDTAEAWNAEIQGRIKNIETGEADLLSADEFRARMRARIKT